VITRIDHVGVVVRALRDAYPFWRDVLGLPVVREAELRDQGVRAALLACGPCEVELLEPTDPDTGIARFLANRGEGLHHLCFESDDVAREVKRFWATGVQMIDTQPRPGLAGSIAFVHPKSCAGVLIEMATPAGPTRTPEAPLSVAAVHMVVESVRAAAQLYRDLFGLKVLFTHPQGLFVELDVGGVVVQIGSGETTAFPVGLSVLRLAGPDPPALRARLDAHGIACRPWSGGLQVGPGGSHGVPLIIQEARPRARR